MKTTLACVLAIAILSCSSPKKEESSSTDSTAVAQDSPNQIEDQSTTQQDETSQEASNEPEAFTGESNNFPPFRLTPLSTDSAEINLIKDMVKMIQAYDTIEYYQITSSYRWERQHSIPSQDGDDRIDTETEEESKTWFFDSNYQLKGYSMSKDYDDGTTQRLYLFSNDSLKFFHEEQNEKSDVSFLQLTRMLASHCPNCGVVSSDEQTTVSTLTEKELAAEFNEFNEALKKLIGFIKAQRKKAKEEDKYLVFSTMQIEPADPDHKAEPAAYQESIYVAKELYTNYVMKK
ncbi:hypothetical protein BH09BAC3_BH09BAC3_12710 [soil metagenome]